MTSVLDLQQPLEKPLESAEPSAEPQEFEFVLGRRQIASLLFVFSVVLMICVAASYVAGKSMTPKAPLPVPVVREPDSPPIVMYSDPVTAPEPPLFAEPKIGGIYIQMGAVERGIAIVFAEGLRKRGLPSFVAPGPSEKIFRVLIGPLPDPASYLKAQEAVDKIGLATFVRKFPN